MDYKFNLGDKVRVVGEHSFHPIGAIITIRSFDDYGNNQPGYGIYEPDISWRIRESSIVLLKNVRRRND